MIKPADEDLETLPPQVVVHVTEGKGLERIVVRVDRSAPADGGLALLGRILPAARELDRQSRTEHPLRKGKGC